MLRQHFKMGDWYPCMRHKFNAIINDSWNSTKSKDAEIRITYGNMSAVWRVLHQASNLEIQIPKKLPNDAPTEAWLSLSNFFQAFVCSYCKPYNSLFVIFREKKFQTICHK